MHWRNIHIQNPYPTESSTRPRQTRYTPTRRQRSNSDHDDGSVLNLSHISS